VALMLCMLAAEQSQFDASKFYGRFTGDTNYQEKKVHHKWKVSQWQHSTCILYLYPGFIRILKSPGI